MNKVLYKCERCGSDVYEYYGSGRFCSYKCARTHAPETRDKISKALIRRNGSDSPSILERKSSKPSNYICEFCGFAAVTLTGLKNHINAHHSYNAIRKYNLIKINGETVDITPAELREYRDSHPCCEICGKPASSLSGHHKQLCVDHNHANGQFRGLLCHACNSCVGWLERNEEAAFQYLNERGRENDVK